MAMNYEYKELIKTYTEYIMDDYEVVDYIEAGKELNHVYKQVAKADEYEAKAKAFDEIMREWENERMTKSHILETIQKFYDHFERNV